MIVKPFRAQMVWRSAPLSEHTKKRRAGAGKSVRLVSAYVCALMPLIYAFSHINYLIPTVGQPLWTPCQAGNGCGEGGVINEYEMWERNLL